jgi:hypothetical protein
LAERLLERSNIVTFVALGALSLLGWAWLMAGAGMSSLRGCKLACTALRSPPQ